MISNVFRKSNYKQIQFLKALEISFPVLSKFSFFPMHTKNVLNNIYYQAKTGMRFTSAGIHYFLKIWTRNIGNDRIADSKYYKPLTDINPKFLFLFLMHYTFYSSMGLFCKEGILSMYGKPVYIYSCKYSGKYMH